MMTRRDAAVLAIALVVGGALVIGGALVMRCPGDAPDDAAWRDSLAVMRQEYAEERAELQLQAGLAMERAQVDSVRASRAVAEQRRYQWIADSLRRRRVELVAPDSTIRDSLRYQTERADLAIAETDTLRVALDSAAAAVSALADANRQLILASSYYATGWIRAEGLLTQERAIHEQQIAGLTQALRREQGRTRKTAALLGAAVIVSLLLD